MVLTIPGVLKAIAALVAAAIVGRWFLDELYRSRRNGEAWYKPYLTLPGILVIIALLIPLIIGILNK